jgi:predicted acyl esterase
MVFGVTYPGVMILRHVLRMFLYPQERWFGGAIPIVFHWVLAAYVLTWGWHHWQNGPGVSVSRHWAWRVARLTGATAIVVTVGAWVLLLLLPSLLARELGMRPAEYAVRIERGVGFQTSDGIQLSADIYHPQRAGPKTPTILVRIPYSKTVVNRLSATIVGQMWVERGYTVVLQGTRGRYESGGRYVPFRHERQDGIETLQWLSRQPWYDGRVGMWGGSYFGYTQWVLADQADPGPQALVIQEASTDFHRMFRPGGAFSLQSALYWAVMSHGTEDNPPSRETMILGLQGWPLIDADQRAATDIPFFNDWAREERRSEYWEAVDGHDRARRSRAPVLLMAGWYDPFLPAQLEDFTTLRREAPPRVARESRLIVGPWAPRHDGHASHGSRTSKLPVGKPGPQPRLVRPPPETQAGTSHVSRRALRHGTGPMARGAGVAPGPRTRHTLLSAQRGEREHGRG